MTPNDGLNAAQIDGFVRDGFLLLRECIPADVVAEMVQEVFRPKGCMKKMVRADKGKTGPVRYEQFPLEDVTQWPGHRFDVDTGHALRISDLSPTLWAALNSLIGPNNTLRPTPMGGRWILNTHYVPPKTGFADPGASGEEDLSRALSASSKHYWHIDGPCERTRLIHRFDALTLLVLWSDVEAGGGGTMYSPDTLDAMLQRLSQDPDGLDTTGSRWSQGIMRGKKVREVTGKAGDVLILHGLSLHSAQPNHRKRVRILENLSLDVSNELNYSPDNPAPSPVEQCVISKVLAYPTLCKSTRRHLERREALPRALNDLVATHPDYFLPNLAPWRAALEPTEQARVHRIDQEILLQWSHRQATAIRHHSPDWRSRIESALHHVRSAMICLPPERETAPADRTQDPSFGCTATSRLLRGFTNRSGLNHVLWYLLRAVCPNSVLYELRDPCTKASMSLVVKVQTDEGWAFVDAGGHGAVFYVQDLEPNTPIPGIPELAQVQNEPIGPPSMRDCYHAGDAVEFESTAHPDGSTLATIPSVQRSTPESPWQAYLCARSAHFFFRDGEEVQRYEALMHKHSFSGLTARILSRYLRMAKERGDR